MLKGLTAQYLLRQTYRVKEGDTILVHAAAGGVGLILCQWGKALGATVIGCVGSPEKAALAKKAGAKHTILYRDEDFAKRVGRDHQGREMPCGLRRRRQGDLPGVARLPEAVRHVRELRLGLGSRSRRSTFCLLAQKGSLFATRPTLFTFLADRARAEKMARDLFRVVERGDVKIQIGRKWPLAEAADAHIALEKRETTGSLILLP